MSIHLSNVKVNVDVKTDKMAPFQEKPSEETGKTNEEDKKNLWSQILNEVQKHGNPKLSPRKQILVLGDNESGKTTMVAKLQGTVGSIF